MLYTLSDRAFLDISIGFEKTKKQNDYANKVFMLLGKCLSFQCHKPP